MSRRSSRSGRLDPFSPFPPVTAFNALEDEEMCNHSSPASRRWRARDRLACSSGRRRPPTRVHPRAVDATGAALISPDATQKREHLAYPTPFRRTAALTVAVHALGAGKSASQPMARALPRGLASTKSAAVGPSTPPALNNHGPVGSSECCLINSGSDRLDERFCASST